MDKKLIIDIAYLLSAVSFIYGLKMLSHPKTARNGNMIASLGMLIAIIATVFLGTNLDLQWIVVAMVIGSIIGAFFALRGEMTQMPQLVAIFNGFGGGASALFGLETSSLLTLLLTTVDLFGARLFFVILFLGEKNWSLTK